MLNGPVLIFSSLHLLVLRNKPERGHKIYSQLSRCSTARESSTGLSLVGLTNVEARKSFLFTEGSLEVKNKEHLLDFVVNYEKYGSLSIYHKKVIKKC